ncbi:plant cysteine oxidase 2-like [Cucumis melo var. makuwa]|uniref:cysteine dioxygenase n=1 Tax=Cucumis melo var. makuwa TaxID=1194695 RepID=A0A5A7TK65_CUCMM|nr:plant cysteine oxidase 2-like [Cucumis melo var. makuwa]
METRAVDRGSNRIGHVNKVQYVRRDFKKRKCRKIKRPPIPVVPMALQELFVSCREVFKGPGTVPLPCDVEKLCCILDNMKAEDVGLSSNLQFFKPNVPVKGSPRVTYTTIYRCDNFSLCIFFLPATGVIPLHNHPGMTVFSKLLLGKMHIKSYDWVDPTNSDDTAQPCESERFARRLAKLKADAVFTSPCSTSVLYPTSGGNIHSFTAITPCAVLDVLGPPYSMEDGRDCSYYKEHPYASFPNGDMGLGEEEGEGYRWLEEIEVPENSQMDGIEYLGPQISDI